MLNLTEEHVRLLLERICPHLSNGIIPGITRELIIESWKKKNFAGCPEIDISSNEWTYNGSVDILVWPRLIKELRTVILSFLMDTYTELRVENVLEDIRAYTYYRYHSDDLPTRDVFAEYSLDLNRIKSAEMQRSFKTPAIKVRFGQHEIEVGTYLYKAANFRKQIIGAIKNRFTELNDETCFTLFKAEEINLEDMTVFTITKRLISYYTDFEDGFYERVPLGTDYYLVFTRNIMTWDNCKAQLIRDGLPEAITQRVSRKMIEKITCFGARMTPIN